MILRKLAQKDVPHMLEWMQDRDVVQNLSTGFETKDERDCQEFIKEAQKCDENLHLAIVDDDDIYMGTVSLKHINRIKRVSEFAITLRKEAMGKGFALYGMKEILRRGIEEMGLDCIYWCVSEDNKRALRFYDKNGYHKVALVPNYIEKYYASELLLRLVWYKFELKA